MPLESPTTRSKTPRHGTRSRKLTFQSLIAAIDEEAAVPAARVLGAGTARLANTSCLALPGVAAETQVIALDLAGVAVSAGSACSSGKVGPSHVLAAMGVDKDIAASAIRISLGWSSAEADVERFLKAWTALAARTAREAAVFAA